MIANLWLDRSQSRNAQYYDKHGIVTLPMQASNLLRFKIGTNFDNFVLH